jgi:hypothetical protein
MLIRKSEGCEEKKKKKKKNRKKNYLKYGVNKRLERFRKGSGFWPVISNAHNVA